MKVDELEKELKKGVLRPAYLVTGEETLLRDEAFSAIRRSVLDGSADDFNLDKLAADQVTPGRLQDAIRGLPVMSQHRLVVLADPDRRRGASGTDLQEAIAEAVSELAEQRETIFVVLAAKADRRTRWVKAFSDPAARIECDAPTQARSLEAFVRREAKRQRVSIEDSAVSLLCERIGPQLMVLRQEIAKLALWVGEGEAVTNQHAADSVVSIADQPVWDLTDAIATGDPGRAVAVLARVRAAGSVDLATLGALASHFRKLAQAKAGTLSAAPFVVRRAEEQARRYSAYGLRRCLERIHHADTGLKGKGSLPGPMVLEDLVIDLTR
ncbi:MAG: DNA polymerase III subunit delta [Myxococcota bacterium]|nr:DNA polymerase III subunit delta [Myxococcota bacterium]